MKHSPILFIGGGNMARAIIIGLIQKGFDPTQIYVVDRNADKRDFFAKTYGIHTAENADEFISIAEIIFLAIKPQGAKELCISLQKALSHRNSLIISIMAGISLQNLSAWMGDQLPIVRAMPNTPASIQLGATGLLANEKVSDAQKQQTEETLKAIGIVAWLASEQDINTITALSGSGPAYYFYFMESMQNAAIKMGIPAEIAKRFAIQTAYGAAKLALESNEDLAQLRAQVTSKKGTTEAALTLMQEKQLDLILEAAMQAAAKRALELSQSS